MTTSDPDDALLQLYSRRILALAADIPHLGRLPAPDGHARRRSPQCGSSVEVTLTLADGTVTGFAQDVRACALGQASAAILGAAVIGAPVAEIVAARDVLRGMLAGTGAAPEGRFAGIEVLRPAQAFPNRHASILLAWDATVAAAQGED